MHHMNLSWIINILLVNIPVTQAYYVAAIYFSAVYSTSSKASSSHNIHVWCGRLNTSSVSKVQAQDFSSSHTPYHYYNITEILLLWHKTPTNKYYFAVFDLVRNNKHHHLTLAVTWPTLLCWLTGTPPDWPQAFPPLRPSLLARQTVSLQSSLWSCESTIHPSYLLQGLPRLLRCDIKLNYIYLHYWFLVVPLLNQPCLVLIS